MIEWLWDWWTLGAGVVAWVVISFAVAIRIGRWLRWSDSRPVHGYQPQACQHESYFAAADGLRCTACIDAAINAECGELAEMLIAKNRAYGNSALDPIRVFSRADTAEQLRVRLDDKLSRIAQGHAAGEDSELDAAGYLVLLRVWRRMQEGER